MTHAVVVGSGPNGLAAATVLHQAGLEVTVFEANSTLGGGAQSGDSPLPGLLQDHCAAVHPMAPQSKFFRMLDWESMGVRWRYAPIDAAHPLDDGDVALLYTSVDRTAFELGVDAKRWKAAFGAPSVEFEKIAQQIMGPMARVPKHPMSLARFGMVAGLPPTMVSAFFRDAKAQALYMGVAAHALQRLDQPMVGGIGAGIITAGHSNGWPVLEGGTGRFTRALVAKLQEAGVTFITDHPITRLSQLPPRDITILDVHPSNAADILGDVQPRMWSRLYRRFRSGPAAFKIDLAVHEGIPWRNPEVGMAGTVHLGGSAKEIVHTERQVVSNRMPERPFVLVGQQAVADPQRATDGLVPIYAYAHVPHNYQGDATQHIIQQIERFAPGVRDRIAAVRTTGPRDFEKANRNFLGGDILTGAKSPTQLLGGPNLWVHPYDTGVPHTYLCSAATPPGPGIHGMGGYNAAYRALHKLDTINSRLMQDHASRH
jgi:phytoene dehydrogenase-like protein